MNPKSNSSVFLLDDDKSIRDSMRPVLKSAGIPLVSYATANEFLAAEPENAVGCLLADCDLPGMGGLELMGELVKQGIAIPVILTGPADVSLAVQAIRGGAFDFVVKPWKDKALLERLREGLVLGLKWAEIQQERKSIARRMAKLTPREREVMGLLATGLKNRKIAEDLGISRKTLDIHRAKVMGKMEARTVADIARWVLMDNPKLLPTLSPD